MIRKNFKFTSKGLQELKEELRQLQETKRPRLIERVAVARSHGDLSENSEYTAAREDLAFVEGRIEELEELIAKAVIIKNGKADGSVKLGSKITLETNGSIQTYELVGEWEADPMKKKISDTSPLGKALLGKKKGDKIEIKAPAGKVKYLIKTID